MKKIAYNSKTEYNVDLCWLSKLKQKGKRKVEIDARIYENPVCEREDSDWH